MLLSANIFNEFEAIWAFLLKSEKKRHLKLKCILFACLKEEIYSNIKQLQWAQGMVMELLKLQFVR